MLNKTNIWSFNFILFFLIYSSNSFCQSLTLEKNYLNDIYRNKQLTDSLFSNNSFTVRPIQLDSLNKKTNPLYSTTTILPFVVQYYHNSDHPFGINLGALYPANGSQLYISGGYFKKYKKLTLQMQPEIIYAENTNFKIFPNEHFGPIWDAYYKWYNKIDLIEKFGYKTLYTILAGQSKIEYDVTKKVSIKISSENIWWGPGIDQGLVLTNNANGFLHFGFQTTEPIQTKYGSFEAQIIIGNLKNSNIQPTYLNKVFHNQFLYNPKLNEQRFITGYVFTFQPKITKGLFLGTANTSIAYYKDAKNLGDYLPFQNFVNAHIDKLNKRANMGSLFARYLLPESGAEVYLEYGRNDQYSTPINLLNGQKYPRGFIAGFRRISTPNKRGIRYSLTTEFAQLDATYKEQVVSAKSWYTNDYVRQGFTNNGKVIGAGIGPGSTSQMLDVSILYGNSNSGLTLQRIANNRDFYFSAYQDYVNWKSHWVDLSAKFHSNFFLRKKVAVNFNFTITNSLNYNWWFIPLTDPILPGRGFDAINYTTNIMFVYSL